MNQTMNNNNKYERREEEGEKKIMNFYPLFSSQIFNQQKRQHMKILTKKCLQSWIY